MGDASNVRPVSPENYVTPRDVKKNKPQSRTIQSFSPGSGGRYGKYAMLREKYQSRARSRPPTASSLSTSSSTSTSSVSSASSPPPQSTSHTENEAETEQFWSRYKRQDTKKQSIGKFIKRALSINLKSRPVRNCKSKTSLDILDQNCVDQAATTGEGLYDEVYTTEAYQQVYYQQLLNKSKLKNRSMSEIVL